MLSLFAIFVRLKKFNDETIGKGSAKSIKKAQSEAAFNALKNLKIIEE